MTQRQQVAVGAAIFNSKDEILLVRRVANDEFMPGMWEIPGGGTEFGETPEQGLKREVMEECGLEITMSKSVAVTDYYIERNDERVQRVEITFLCKLADASAQVKLSNEHDAFTWKNLDEVNTLPLSEYMKSIVQSVTSY